MVINAMRSHRQSYFVEGLVGIGGFGKDTNEPNPPIIRQMDLTGGLGGKGGAADTLTNNMNVTTSAYSDNLNISKHRKVYEDMITAHEHLVDTEMLVMLITYNIDDSNKPEKASEFYTRLNALQSAKGSLAAVMKYVDKN